MTDLQELRRLAEAAALRQQIFNVEGTMASMARLDYANNDLSRASHPQAILSLLTELETLRDTNQRLNRRCQQAEAAAAEKVEAVKADLLKAGVRGRPLGRMLANFRCAQLEDELELARAVVRAGETAWMVPPRVSCNYAHPQQDIFHPDGHPHPLTTALAAYRAAYPAKEGT